MSPQLRLLSHEYDLTIVANGSVGEMIPALSHIKFVSLDIQRKISIGCDISTLFNLWRFFRAQRFDVVHSITPKAGLLAVVAAKAAGTPFRLHTFTGQVWAAQSGLKKMGLKALDRLIAHCATRVFADSRSQRLFLIENKVVPADRIDVLADGSAAGVDLNRFRADDFQRCELRRMFHIADNDIIFLFVGRLTRDKGLLDLTRAFASVAAENEKVHLMVVGPDEDGLELDVVMLANEFTGRVHRVGFTESPERYMAAADILCLPSYREGFGAVIIEAAAVGLPAIASRIYGITDAVDEGITGILHRPAATDEIIHAMSTLASDEGARKAMGYAARVRVAEKFSEACVTGAFAEFYQTMLGDGRSRSLCGPPSSTAADVIY
jgi:glycosyltransferase involved in cell wall biosynthesis